METSELGPVFSIILCNYNYCKYISEAIESVLAQDFEDFELIVVDDGSTDDSRSIIATFDDPRIKKIHRKNGGQAAAFNTGFAESTGQFIAFVDSDDRWVPNKLNTVFQRFSEENIIGIQHNLLFMDSNSNCKNVLHPALATPVGIVDYGELVFRRNEFPNGVATSGITLRRNACDQIFPLNESWRICADLPLRKAFLTGLVLNIAEPLGYYRVHGSNNWFENQTNKDHDYKNLFERAHQDLNEWINNETDLKKQLCFKCSRDFSLKRRTGFLGYCWPLTKHFFRCRPHECSWSR